MEKVNLWEYSSVVERPTADRTVPGSTPGAPSVDICFNMKIG